MDDERHDLPDFSFSHRNSEMFTKHFAEISDDQTAVLKSHLLLESMLRDFCVRSVRNPVHLQAARLSFKQVALLARSLSMIQLASLDYCWLLIDKLNSLRNMMAHELEPDATRMTNIREAMVTMVRLNKAVDDESTDPTDLKQCLSYLCGMVDALLQTSLAFDEIEIKRLTTNTDP